MELFEVKKNQKKIRLCCIMNKSQLQIKQTDRTELFSVQYNNNLAKSNTKVSFLTFKKNKRKQKPKSKPNSIAPASVASAQSQSLKCYSAIQKILKGWHWDTHVLVMCLFLFFLP